MTYEVGDRVTVKPPFNESFPDAYTITEIVENGDFDAIFLEPAQ